MKPPLRALIIDNSPDDAKIVEHELRKEFTLECMRVDNAAAMRMALEEKSWDVVISAFVIPLFSGLEALKILQEKGLDVPSIMMSGKMGEEEAVVSMKSGAHDYLRKDNLSRLIPAIKRELMDADVRRERKKAMEQLRVAQKMEAVGLLAGGISHDFNNLLTVINGYSNLLIHDLAEQPTLRDHALKILRAGERAAELTQQLLSFSRKQILEPRVLNLNSVVKDLEKMLSRIIGEQIELVTILSDRIGMVKADSGQLQQIIMNLAVNARDAVASGGRITIETTNREIDAGFVHENMGAVAGEYVMVSVTDDGPGISDEVKAHIFEPFFTTKEQGKGTGLGLATVYGIVKQSEGYIQVISAPGQGASFRVFLPRVHQQPDQQGKTRKAVAPAGKQTILAVDDKLEVLNFIAHALSKHGYTVIRANSPNEALKLFDQQMDQIDLLLTDVIMPFMSGPQLVRKLLAKKPTLRVILMSGHPTDIDHFQEIIEQGTAFLSKPFLNGALIDKVEEALGNANLTPLYGENLDESKHIDS